MRRRTLMKLSVGAAVTALTTACPFDSVTKDKAVKYSNIAIGYLNDILPIAGQLGGTQVAGFINKAIPALEKLRDALEKADIPTAGDLFKTVTSLIGQTATALLQLPQSAHRDTAIGILTLVQITLRTVSLFVESEMSSVADMPATVRAAADTAPLLKAFEATRF